MKKLISFLLIVCLNSCAVKIKQDVEYVPTPSRLKLAVLPFITLDSDGKVAGEEEGRLLIDNLSLSSEPVETPAQTVRKQVLNSLLATNYRLVSKEFIDVNLPHAGFAIEGNKLNYDKLYSTDAKSICNKALNCDAVMFGRVIKFDRAYYGVETIHDVAIEIKIVSAKDNKILFQSTGSDFETRGVSKGPTGISSVITAPLQGLDRDITSNLSRKLVQKILEPLVVYHFDKNKTDVPPPAIYALSYSSLKSRINDKNPLTIVLMASPKSTVSAKIKGTSIDVPLIERSPGHYTGKLYLLNNEKVNSNGIVVNLEDSARQKVQAEYLGEEIHN